MHFLNIFFLPSLSQQVQLELSYEMSFDQVTEQLARQLSVPAQRICFYSPTSNPRQPTRFIRKNNSVLREMMWHINNDDPKVLCFDVLDFPASDLDTHRLLPIQLCTLDCKLTPKEWFLVPHQSTVQNFLGLVERRFITTKAAEAVGECSGYIGLQLVTVDDGCRIKDLVPPNRKLDDLQANCRVDMVPPQLKQHLPLSKNTFGIQRLQNALRSSQLVYIAHYFVADSYIITHGVPFCMAVEKVTYAY
jgi:hypothetical protein